MGPTQSLWDLDIPHGTKSVPVGPKSGQYHACAGTWAQSYAKAPPEGSMEPSMATFSLVCPIFFYRTGPPELKSLF